MSPAAAIAPDRLGSSAKATQAEVAADAMQGDDRDDRARAQPLERRQGERRRSEQNPDRECQLERSFDSHRPRS